jgi:HEAT repeat protein
MADLRLLGAVLPLAVAVLVALVELVALVLRRRRARRLLVAALDDPSPLERRAALRVLVNGGGVRRFVDVLTERVRFEEDPTVRDELARALVARGFEGSGTDDLSALRLWAFEHEIRKALAASRAPEPMSEAAEGNPGR